jgi:copper chaperone NosL
MVITDSRFGAELVTKKGKVYKFDANECLAAFYLKKRLDPKDVRSLWVTDFSHPKAFLEAEQANYLRAERLQSPMGLGLLAFKTKENALEAQGHYGGKPLGWREVLSLVKSEWLELGKHAAHKAR